MPSVKVPSSPLIPLQDPTLLLTTAGMVQFKRAFLGEEKRGYARATTYQKYVRAGGKHNDLENVGRTARHHTFFEMLGNFSFGDYFKAEAIPFAWELLTKDFGIDKTRLLTTVYHTDDEAFDLWRKISELPEERIILTGFPLPDELKTILERIGYIQVSWRRLTNGIAVIHTGKKQHP